MVRDMARDMSRDRAARAGREPDRPLVSCIMPVYNAERFVGEAVDSIFAQTYRPIEVVVVDDGSTDGSAAVLTRYGDRIRYVRQPNAGASAARNRGVGLARGPLVAFLDADDVWLPRKLERQVEHMRARPELDFCVTYLQNVRVSGAAPALPVRAHEPTEAPLPGYGPPAIVARRTLFERVGGFDPTLRRGEDTDWLLRALEAGAVHDCLEESLVIRRLHDGNLTGDTAGDMDLLLRLLKNSVDRRRGRA